jgi:Fe-S-cluster containining protein
MGINMDPFGLNISDKKKVKAMKKVRKQLAALPNTTCSGRAECCNAGCPNMTYAEYLCLRTGFIDTMSKDERLELLMKCIKRYITKQDPVAPRPCLLLTEHGTCSVYAERPYRCRTYGLIPSGMYRRMVGQVAKDAGVARRRMPLCEQCPFVKIAPEQAEEFPGGKIPRGLIERIEVALHENDLRLGIPEEIQKKGLAYLTFHDWHLMIEIGEGWMGNLSEVRLIDDELKKEQFLGALKNAVAGLYEEGR